MKNIAIFFCFYFCNQLLTAQICINSATNFSADSGTLGVCSADFNNDKKKDIVTCNYSANNISLLINDGNGNFTSPINFNVGSSPRYICTSDFNKDGKPDVAVVNENSGNVSILLGDGNANFSNAVDYSVGTTPRSIVAKDINNDGFIDLLTSNFNSNNISVLLGEVNGTFSNTVNFSSGTNPHSISVGDFNNDNNLDVITANWGSDDVSLLIGDGNGSFASPTSISLGFAGVDPVSIIAVDVNKDNKLDILTANNSSHNISLLLGNGNGTFPSGQYFSVGSRPFSVNVGDFDADGNLDLVAANYFSNNISVLSGNGQGNFTNTTNYSTGSSTRCVITEDFNKDHKTDIVSVNMGSNNVSVLLNCSSNALCSSVYAVDTRTECDSLIWIDGITYYSNNNTATYTFMDGASNGCDSIVTLDLTISNSTNGIDEISACNSYTWIDGITYTENNNTAKYIITGGNLSGCDSIITLNLTINNVADITTSLDGLTITANNNEATYQWLDCNNNFSEIPNQTTQSFLPSINGSYAVQLTQNGCVDSSECILISTVGTKDISLNSKITISPNPFNNEFSIDLGKIYNEFTITIMDLNGKEVFSSLYKNSKNSNINLNVQDGIYIINIQNDFINYTNRIIKF